MDNPKRTTERGQTDESLRDERAKSDRAIRDERERATQVADDVLRRARADADAVLLLARDRADHVAAGPAPTVDAEQAVATERAAADATLRDERAEADETLDLERAETSRVLANLLQAERLLTDGKLSAERLRSDTAVSNRDDFLGVVAHDLRDLLSVIAISTRMIANAPASADPEVALEVARIARSAARAHTLIRDLLDVASIDAGRLLIATARCDLSVLLADVADEFRRLAAAKNIDLRVEVDPVLEVGCDRVRLFQVFGNLIGNSIKFAPPETAIVIRAERRADHLRCSVTDTGPGIPADKTDSVFERFTQIDSNNRRGLGLGLFIAKHIVEGHGGKIWAESTPGHGTSVLFEIPIRAADPAAGN